MRKFLQILGVIFLALFGGLVVLIGIAAYSGHKLDVESKAYVDAAVPAIAAHWDPQALSSRAAPDLFANADTTAQDNLFFQLSLLGPMLKYEGSTCNSSTFYTTNNGSQITAQCVSHIRLRDGDYIIHTYLKKLDGQWKIAGFHMNRS